MLKITC